MPYGSLYAEERHRGEMNTIFRFIIIVVACSILIRSFIMQSTVVNGESMEPTLHTGDRLLVAKAENYERSDIVIFQATEEDWYVKRIIGLPGDTVYIIHNQLYVNGEPMEESYLKKDYLHDWPSVNYVYPHRIPPEHYFVLGDNRLNSTDSREFGLIHKDLIGGRALVKYWPLQSMQNLVSSKR